MTGPYMAMARQLRERGLIRTVVACDVVADKAHYVREELGIPRFVTDYREVVTAPDVDVVLVLTSMPDHGPVALAALEAGKHVLVEKPMAITLDEAAKLVEVARESTGHLVCAPAVILSPTYQEIWGRLRREEIGRIHLARSRYGWSGPWWGQWYYRSGGGPLFDLGVYNVTSLTGWLGPVRRVTAMAGTAIPDRVVDGESISVEVEDNFQILLDFGDARLASVTTGFSMQQYRGAAIELYGSTGTVQMMGVLCVSPSARVESLSALCRKDSTSEGENTSSRTRYPFSFQNVQRSLLSMFTPLHDRIFCVSRTRALALPK